MQIKSKAVMSWSSRKKKERIFCTVYFVWSKFFLTFGFISKYSVLNKLSEYIYFYIAKKHYFIHFCCLFLKSSKSYSVSLMENFIFCGVWPPERVFTFVYSNIIRTSWDTEQQKLRCWEKWAPKTLKMFSKRYQFFSGCILSPYVTFRHIFRQPPSPLK